MFNPEKKKISPLSASARITILFRIYKFHFELVHAQKFRNTIILPLKPLINRNLTR